MRRHSPALLGAVFLLAASCRGPDGAPPPRVLPLPPPPAGQGFQLSMHAVAPAHEEIWKCQILPGLPADGVFQYVNRAESRQTGGMHHADVATLFYTGLDLAPGQYDCEDLYREHPQLMEDAIFVYASQLAEDSLALPEGVVAGLPQDSLYMYEMHYVNPSDQDLEVVSYLNAWTIPKSEVRENIYGNVNRDVNILVPAGATDHVEWTRCVFPEDVDILFLSSHTHELATRFELRAFDGAEAGDLVYENDDWHAPRILRFDEPLHVRAGAGFEYTCFYSNPRDDDVTWGFTAADEMCQFGYVFTPGDAAIECVTVATSDGLGVD